jgi:L-ascorbate oxidase
VLTNWGQSTASSDSSSLQDDPDSVWMLVNGSAKADISELDPIMLHPFESSAAPPSMDADLTKSFMINQTDVVTWVVDRYPYQEADVPIVFGESSDGWLANTTQHMPLNSTIDIIMSIANDSMDTVSSPHGLVV